MATLITGGTGFIGAELARLLLGRGEEDITIFDISDSTQRLDEVAGRVKLMRGDLGDFSHVLNAVQESSAEVVYHLGGMLSVPSDNDPPAGFRVNAMGTFHVLEAARLFGVQKVIFASSIGTYSLGLPEEGIDDLTLQRPQLLYGACKLFGEHLGLFYRRKYGIDYRAVRYPPIVGPGVRSPGVTQYASWVIEECAKGNPFTIWARPDTKAPMLYFKDAALAILKLAEAPAERIEMVNYLLAGADPTPSAAELAQIVEQKIPGARIDFEVDQEVQQILDRMLKPLDDRCARQEWDWQPSYQLGELVDDFLRELKENPQRYAR
jgi:nucleoside-diphosphate-sugar epimerase